SPGAKEFHDSVARMSGQLGRNRRRGGGGRAEVARPHLRARVPFRGHARGAGGPGQLHEGIIRDTLDDPATGVAGGHVARDLRELVRAESAKPERGQLVQARVGRSNLVHGRPLWSRLGQFSVPTWKWRLGRDSFRIMVVSRGARPPPALTGRARATWRCTRR